MLGVRHQRSPAYLAREAATEATSQGSARINGEWWDFHYRWYSGRVEPDTPSASSETHIVWWWCWWWWQGADRLKG